ncbi:hypothetical protein [Salsipaludibacter albus]|uniref:hypothetical protein n=1 Tax=Salsipaludibacter albus TaxID=2849650 RepID=UPI001EE42765|nr:hypothetical protein [Salsipaludibacter albus]MBY5162831.1 hypothetical protein [Salsipaludibacter albus]
MTEDTRALRREVAVEHPNNRLDAELRRGALQMGGVDARVGTDDAGGMHPHLGPAAGGLHLLVPADQVDLARELLRELDDGTFALDDD